MDNVKPGYKAYLAGLGFSIIVGISFLAAKLAGEVGTAMQTVGFRFGFGLLTAAVLIITGIYKVNYKKANMKLIIFIAFSYAGFMGFQMLGIQRTTTIESGILFAIVPVLTAILAAIFLKEKTSFMQNLFVLVSVTGIVLMFVLGASSAAGDSFKLDVVGYIFLFLSNLLVASSNIGLRALKGSSSPMEIGLVMMIMGTVVFNAIALVEAGTAGTLSQYFAPLANVRFLVAVAFLGIFSSLLTSMLMSYVSARMKAVQVSLFSNLATAISIIAGAIVMSEPLAWYHIFCTGLIIAGVIGMSMASDKSHK